VPPNLEAMSASVRNSLVNAVSVAFERIGVLAPAAIALQRPALPEHGDWATSAALAAAKAAGRNPRELAEALKAMLDDMTVPHLSTVEIAGPGFLNFRLDDSWLHEVIEAVINEGREYGRPNVGNGRTVNVEYVSANPTGPLHAGHARWAAYGDALSRLLTRAGFSVHKEFYINDRGVQMQKFAKSLLARQAGTDVPEGGYQGQYIRDWAADMPTGLDEAAALEWGYAKALDYQRSTMKRMNVEFDTFSSERAIGERGEVESTLEELRAAGHLYIDTRSQNESQRDPATVKGAMAKDEDAPDAPPATWLRTTSFLDSSRKNRPFDDADRVLVKGDGQYTYFLPDIAYHRDKFNRGSLLIDILGADHHGYVGRMKAAVMALGHDPHDLEIIIGQNVILMRDGVEVKMSKRTGDLIELAELIDEIGADAAKLTFLLQSIDTRQTVDLDALIAGSLDNPVHYIHYAHARIHGIGRKAETMGVSRRDLKDVSLNLLVHESELDVARLLGDLDEVLTIAANERAPHKVTTWIRELAAAFQKMYHDCPILRSDVDDELRQARLVLVEACRIGLAIGLDTLGVSAPERMDSLETELVEPLA
jgi:arginyl-tRNA synthetase